MITLTNDLVIDVDQNNYILMLDKHRLDKKGKCVYETLGYYGSLVKAVIGARNYCIKERLNKGEYSMAQTIAIIRSTADEFTALLKEKVGDV